MRRTTVETREADVEGFRENTVLPDLLATSKWAKSAYIPQVYHSISSSEWRWKVAQGRLIQTQATPSWSGPASHTSSTFTAFGREFKLRKHRQTRNGALRYTGLAVRHRDGPLT
jgi:hypothetical protein